MQRGSADKNSRILILTLLGMLAIVMVLYFMKRSELTAFRTELILAKSQAVEVEEAFNRKIADFQQQILSLDQKVSATQTHLTKCEDELQSNDNNLEEKISEITKCNEQILSTKESMKQTQVELDDMKGKNEILNKQLATAHGALITCQADQGCKDELAKCQQSLTDMNGLLSECNAHCPAANNQGSDVQ